MPLCHPGAGAPRYAPQSRLGMCDCPEGRGHDGERGGASSNARFGRDNAVMVVFLWFSSL
jgi:hypothetical protein